MPSLSIPTPDAAAGPRHVILCTPLRGTLVPDTGPAGPLAPGWLLLVDSERPVVTTASEGAAVAVLSVPRTHLACTDERLARACGRPYDATAGTASLLHPLLLGLVSRAAVPYAVCTATRLRNQVADLVAALVVEAGEPAFAGAESDPSGAVRDWVSERLGASDLSPGVIAAAHFVSVRRLHKWFEREGKTVGGWVQGRRLRECGRELGRGDGRVRKVGVVGQRWGFANAAHFSRAFRAEYGMSPREWRDLRAEPPVSRGGEGLVRVVRA